MAKFTPALALAVCVTSLGTAGAQDMAKPLGKWECKIGKNHVTLIVEENRLHVINLGEKPCTLHADYTLTKDGVVYGIVTSIECDEDEDGNSPDKLMVDLPFSCRFRVDEGALLIRDMRSGIGDNREERWNGRFKAVNPAPARTAVIPPPPPSSNRLVPHPAAPANASNSSFGTSSNEQVFQFWTGFSR